MWWRVLQNVCILVGQIKCIASYGIVVTRNAKSPAYNWWQWMVPAGQSKHTNPNKQIYFRPTYIACRFYLAFGISLSEWRKWNCHCESLMINGCDDKNMNQRQSLLGTSHYVLCHYNRRILFPWKYMLDKQNYTLLPNHCIAVASRKIQRPHRIMSIFGAFICPSPPPPPKKKKNDKKDFPIMKLCPCVARRV